MGKNNRFFEEEEQKLQSKKRERPRDPVYEQLVEQIDWMQVQAEERYKNKKRGKKREKWEDDYYEE